MSIGILLFADGVAPSWTDKEVMIAVGSAVAALIPIVGTIMSLVAKSYRDQAKKAANKIAILEKEVLDRSGPPASATIADLEAKFKKVKDEADRLAVLHAETAKQATAEKQLADKLKTDLDSVQENLVGQRQEANQLQRRLDRAFHKDGQIWREKVLANAPDFKPLEPGRRTTPVISVLNLKGGVGKTTITANLGAAFDAMGYRVLLLDLDLQGSLTSLYLTDQQQEQVYNQNQMMADFLSASFEGEYPKLYEFMQSVLPEGKSSIVPTTDGLAYAEANLTIRWMLREGRTDSRFLLRKELQYKRITDNYDIVLMDCPPLINMCCVNALAASDYVLVPILPSLQATARVPVLLKRIKEVRENLNAELNVMGIIANRTHRSELTIDEENRLSALRGQCKDILGHEVPQLETFIRQSVEVRVAEDEHRPLQRDGEMFKQFAELAKEVESLLPTFCLCDRSVNKATEAVA